MQKVQKQPLKQRLKTKLNNIKTRVLSLLKNLKTRIISLLKNPRHDVALAITVVFIVISALCFQNSWLRIGESFRDIYTSLAHALADKESTVNRLSAVDLQDLGILPKDLPLFLVKLKLYGLSLLDKNTYLYFFIDFGNVAKPLAIIILLAFVPILLLLLVICIMLHLPNNDFNKDTKPLKFVKFIANYTWRPLKSQICGYVLFLKEHKAYPIIWAVIWSLNFNFLTIILEVIAYYYYFVAGFDFVNLYIQLYKLLLDLSTLILFFPPWAWAVIFIIGFDVFRKFVSLKKLKKNEKKCEEIVAELPVAVFITGTMGTGKTTFNTELAITYNKYFRDVANKKMFEMSMRFPDFPWINAENCVKFGLEHHTIYNLATCRQFVKFLKKCHEFPGDNTVLRLRILKSRYGYNFDNFLFDYDSGKYGFSYYDNLENKNIFDILEEYLQLYFIYVISCSLMIANYSIRVDDFKKDKGNFPLWDIDFFRKDSEEIGAHSRRSHIIDFDALRLGLKFVEDGRFKDSIDFGVIVVTEIGKERANQKTIKGEYFSYERTDKDGNNVTVTPDSDLMNLDIKECRHRATVDNFPFVVWLLDDNRAASLNADNKELCDLLYIVKASDYKFITPYFALDELIYNAASKLMQKFHDKDRFYKGNNTLFRHTLRNFFSRFIFKPYEKNFNMYSVSTLEFKVQDGKESDDGHKLKYRMSKKKIHSARFATDCYGDYYYEKTKRSRAGIIDIPEYAGKQATRGEMNSTHGYFPRGMDMMFPKETD